MFRAALFLVAGLTSDLTPVLTVRVEIHDAKVTHRSLFRCYRRPLYDVPPPLRSTGPDPTTPCLKKVKGCTTLIPPIEVLLLSENSVRDVCGAVWVGCFTANPSEVAFDLLCRLMRWA